MKTFNRIMLVIVLIALTGGIGLFVLTAINPDLVYSWFGQAQEKPVTDPEEKPTTDEEIKDFNIVGNKITGYAGTDVVVKVPTSYSVEIGEIKESVEVTLEEYMNEDYQQELNNKLMQGFFYCTPKGADKFFSNTAEEWSTQMGKLFQNEEAIKSAFPLVFEFCETKIIAGDNFQITTIGASAFSENTIISEVIIPEGIRIIEDTVFSGCSNLTKVELPSTLESIGSAAFGDTALETIDIPENVTNMSYAFINTPNLKTVYIYSSNLSASSIINQSTFINTAKIYVPDDYYANNYEQFKNWKERIYPMNGTYPEEPDPEPEEKTVTVILMNGVEQVYSQDYVTGSYINFLDLGIEEPTQEGKLFLGWIMQGKDEILSNFNVTEAYGSTIVFEAKFYDEPQVLEEFDVNGNIKSDVETFTISSNYYFIKKHTNIATYSSKEEFLKAKDLYNGKNFAYKNESGSYTYLNQIDLELYEPNFTYPLTCSSIEISVYDLKNLTDEEISNFLQRNYYFKDIEGETYIGSEYEVCEYKDFQQSFSNSNLKTIILSEEITSLYDTVFADCQHLEKLIIKRDFLVSVYTNEGEVSDNLQLPDNCQIYVPDELLGEYKAVSFYQKYKDNIHTISELN